MSLSRLPVTHFYENTRVVHEQDSFYHLVFTLNDLPYVAVLDRENPSAALFDHNTMLQWLAQAWTMPNAGFAYRLRPWEPWELAPSQQVNQSL